MKPKKSLFIHEQHLTKNFACTVPLEKVHLHQRISQSSIDQKKLRNLIRALKRGNMLEPIKVLRQDDKYEVVEGLHRFTAAVQTGEPTIPVIIVEEAEAKFIIEQFIEEEEIQEKKKLEHLKAPKDSKDEPETDSVETLKAQSKNIMKGYYKKVKEVDALNEEIKKRDAEMERLIEENKEVLILRNELKAHEDKLHEMKVKKNELSENYQGTVNELNQKDVESKNLSNVIDNLNNSIAKAESRNLELTKEMEKLQEKVKDQQDLYQKVADLEWERDKLTDEANALQADLDQQINELNRTKDELEKVTDRMDKVDVSMVELERENREQASRLEGTDDTIKGLEAYRDRLEEKNQNLSKVINELTLELENNKVNKSALANERDEAVKVVEAIRYQRDQLEEKYEQTKLELDELTDASKRLMNNTDIVIIQRDEAFEKIKTLEFKNQQLEERLNKIIAEKDNINRVSTQAERDKTLMMEKINKLEKSANSLNAEKDRLVDTLYDLREKFRHKEHELERLISKGESREIEFQKRLLNMKRELIRASLDEACYRLTTNLLRYQNLSWANLDSKIDDLLLEAINVSKSLELPDELAERFLRKAPLDNYNKGEFLRNLAHAIFDAKPNHPFLESLISTSHTL